MVNGDHGHRGHLALKHVEGEVKKEQDNVTILLQPMEGKSVQVPAAALQEASCNTQTCNSSGSGLPSNFVIV